MSARCDDPTRSSCPERAGRAPRVARDEQRGDIVVTGRVAPLLDHRGRATRRGRRTVAPAPRPPVSPSRCRSPRRGARQPVGVEEQASPGPELRGDRTVRWPPPTPRINVLGWRAGRPGRRPGAAPEAGWPAMITARWSSAGSAMAYTIVTSCSRWSASKTRSIPGQDRCRGRVNRDERRGSPSASAPSPTRRRRPRPMTSPTNVAIRPSSSDMTS